MKEANRAPAYVVLYHSLCDVARKYGYALAIHGSVVTDLDLIAIPWVDETCSAEELKDFLMNHIEACGYGDLLRREGFSEETVKQIMETKEHRHLDGVTIKPHGRKAWNIYLGGGAKVDLSIMPKIIGENK